MKVLYYLLSVAILLFSTFFLNAQVKTESPSLGTVVTQEAINSIPYAKGKWEYSLLRPIVNYDYWKNSSNGQSLGSQYDLGIDWCTNYFFVNRFGAGLEFEGDWTGTHYNSDITTSKWMVYGDLMYGIPLGRDYSIYGRLSAGFGKSCTTYKSGTTSSSNKDDLFGIRGTVGMPFRVFDNGPIYFTPTASWNYLQSSFDGGKIKDNGLRVGLGFEAYMGCREFSCGLHHGANNPRGVYQPGTSFFDISTKGHLALGTEKFTYTGISTSQEQSYSRESLKLGYYYYVLPNFAVGANLEYGGSYQKDKSSNNKLTTMSWVVSPMVEWNLPVDNCWNNLFFRGGVGFGSQKNTSDNGTTSSSTKDNVFGYGFYVGYNDFIGKRLALTPKFGYEWRDFKNTTSNTKLKSNGVVGELGIRVFLGPKWKF